MKVQILITTKNLSLFTWFEFICIHKQQYIIDLYITMALNITVLVF